MKAKAILALSLPLAALTVIASSIALFTPNFYSKETANWAAQSTGQDMTDLLLIAPVLLIASIFAARKNRSAIFIWGGTNLYLLYTFIIYCFDIHFNKLFLVYCFALGLSFYSFFYFLLSMIEENVLEWFKSKRSFRFIGIYFLLISLIFCFAWLSEVLPALITNNTPRGLIGTNLFTNPVHVVDLSVFLPGLFLTGMLLLKKKPLGLLMTPIMLSFFILMDITIGGLVLVMKEKGSGGDFTVTIVMSLLAVFSVILLIIFLKDLKQPSDRH